MKWKKSTIKDGVIEWNNQKVVTTDGWRIAEIKEQPTNKTVIYGGKRWRSICI